MVKMVEEIGLLADLDQALPIKRRRRGYAPIAALDLMLLTTLGGECVDDLEV